MEKVINHNLGKEAAIKLVKKAASQHFALMNDNGAIMKFGAPMMTATVKVTDTTIEVSGKGAGSPVGNTIASDIEAALENNEQSNTLSNQQQSAPKQASKISCEEYLEYQSKAISLIKQYKELFEEGILTEEEFKAKKEDILNFINGMTR